LFRFTNNDLARVLHPSPSLILNKYLASIPQVNWQESAVPPYDRSNHRAEFRCRGKAEGPENGKSRGFDGPARCDAAAFRTSAAIAAIRTPVHAIGIRPMSNRSA